VLNLFAYTGAASIACAQAGAQVTHVDVAAPLPAHEGARYDAVVLDPPTFGRGPGKQTWKIEESLLDLLDAVSALLGERARFALLSCHTPGYSGIALENLLRDALRERGGRLQSGEMHVRQDDGTLLPSGFFARWSGEHK
jgi:23S rRNA (cytosine1962-C5)-methyltransferase